VLAPDGCIYGFPSHAERVLKINCATGEVRPSPNLHRRRQSTHPLSCHHSQHGHLAKFRDFMIGVKNGATSLRQMSPKSSRLVTIRKNNDL
jgi:hypothetical protein